MDSVIKSFLTLFCLLMFFFTISGVAYAGMSMKNADGYAASVSQEISECDFADDVVQSLKTEAEADGYGAPAVKKNGKVVSEKVDALEVEPVDMDNDDIPDIAYVTLNYRLEIPFFGYTSSVHHIRTIAR